jgi:hypothetical protein
MVHAQQTPGGAKVLRTGETSLATGATDQRIRDDAATIVQATDEFVTEDERRFAPSTVAEEARDIGAANTSQIYRNFHLAWRGHGAGTVFHFDLIRCYVHQGSHTRRIVYGVREKWERNLDLSFDQRGLY